MRRIMSITIILCMLFAIAPIVANATSVTGIELNENEIKLMVGAEYTITASILPADATNKKIIWRSINPDIAKVTNGVVTALAEGEATVLAITEDGNRTAMCIVTVIEKKFAGGDGTVGNPYLISNEEELANVNDYPDASYKMINDIELVEKKIISKFTGNFNGNGYAITGLSTNLFGTNEGNIFSLEIKGCNIQKIGSSGTTYASAIAYSNNGTIMNCSVSGEIKAEDNGGMGAVAGAIVCKNQGKVTFCVNTANVTAKSDNSSASAGGIVGDMYSNAYYCKNSGEIASYSRSGATVAGGIVSHGGARNSFNTGKITAFTDNYNGGCAGGIAGSSTSDVLNCYNTGEVKSTRYSGGIVGICSGSVESSYNIGAVESIHYESASEMAGGIAGTASDTAIKSSYFLADASKIVGDNDQYTNSPYSLEQMMQQESFTGFDFENTWVIYAGRTPELRMNLQYDMPSADIESLKYSVVGAYVLADISVVNTQGNELVCVAAYNASGKLLALQNIDLTNELGQAIFPKNEILTIKAFILSDSRPVCRVKKLTIQ